ncbi:hypothetical protein J7384_10250 [Endozoicomonas sp. G2_1]|uniref:hypothetical protein n=1 Tax=Endozoicomonas sp. G2_1 TaxID=2821091 RepID=UPI001ADB9F35|nr:hypothetical protein [Endozoicomonas sp. G2_1]MBO9490741.1 hypothetical protein [Endozoicomonas sp. G2_1]
MNNFKLSKVALAIMLALGMTACSSNYQFGDVSRAYCASTSPDFRLELKHQLNEQGVQVGVDYCSAFGLVDAMARR